MKHGLLAFTALLPVLTPQIAGGDLPPGLVTLNESVSQFPSLFPAPSAPSVPKVVVVSVTFDISFTDVTLLLIAYRI